MKDFYQNTRNCINRYNEIVDKVHHGTVTNDEEDEFIENYCIYLAHSLIKDTGSGQLAREELGKMADIINDVIR